MSATFDPSLTTAIDRVRFRLGDTVVCPAEAADLSDEEISAVLTRAGDDELATALACAKAVLARYSKLAGVSIGDSNIQYGEMIDSYRTLVEELQRELSAGGGGAMPYAGGISRADKAAREANTDRVEPAFSRDGVGSMGRTSRSRFGEW